MWKKLKLWYRRSKILRSLRTRIFIIIFLSGLIPCLLVQYGILAAYRSRAVSLRTSEVRTQMRVIANHLITYGYINDPSSYSVNAELSLFSTLNDGRVLVIDNNLKVIKDTYGIAEGKTIVTPEVVKCLQQGSAGASSNYDKTIGYIEMYTPIVETAALELFDVSSSESSQNETVRGVLLTSVSTDSIEQTRKILSQQAVLIEALVLLVLFVIAFFVSDRLVKPFDRLTQHIGEVREGISNETVQEPAYYETEQIVGAFNRVLARLNALDESRNEFVSNVSHELKTPMASMKVLADSLLSETDVPPEMYREFLEDIDSEIDRENKIVSDLLDLAKMENKAVHMNITSVDIGELTETICKRIRPLAKKRGIEITLVVERPVKAEVDEVKISLALTNLIENAVKYNKDNGKVKVAVDADHQNFTVSVSDTGVGIPEQDLDKIYDRFYRVDKSRSREVGGTGLGLAITKNAVVLHRGSISVKSKLGEGSAFTMRIPLTYITEPGQSKMTIVKKKNPSENARNAQLEKSLKKTEDEIRRKQASLRRTEARIERRKKFLHLFTLPGMLEEKKEDKTRVPGELTAMEKLAETKTIDTAAVNAAIREMEEKSGQETTEKDRPDAAGDVHEEKQNEKTNEA